MKCVGKMWLLNNEFIVLNKATPLPLLSSSVVNELEVFVSNKCMILSNLDASVLMLLVVFTDSTHSTSPMFSSSELASASTVS